MRDDSDSRAAKLALAEKLGIELPGMLSDQALMGVIARELRQRGWAIHNEAKPHTRLHGRDRQAHPTAYMPRLRVVTARPGTRR